MSNENIINVEIKLLVEENPRERQVWSELPRINIRAETILQYSSYIMVTNWHFASIVIFLIKR